MLSTVYHKKTFVLKIPLHPPLPKGDNKDYRIIFMRFLPTHLREDPEMKQRNGEDKWKSSLLYAICSQTGTVLP